MSRRRETCFRFLDTILNQEHHIWMLVKTTNDKINFSGLIISTNVDSNWLAL